jgi:ATP-dependent Clp protease ATP-binding subunit ClpB
MDYKDFTLITQNALRKGSDIAKEKRHKAIENGHILKGILETDKNVTPFILRKMDVDIAAFAKLIAQIVDEYPYLKKMRRLLFLPMLTSRLEQQN